MRFMNFVRSVPMATAVIALSFATLGNLLVPSFMGVNDAEVAVPRDGILTFRFILGGISLFILVIFVPLITILPLAKTPFYSSLFLQ